MSYETLPEVGAIMLPVQGACDVGYYTYGDVEPTRLGVLRGLTRECRFAGQTEVAWTVLQHSALVYTLANKCLDAKLYPALHNGLLSEEPTPIELYALLHDAPEAYYKDLPWPMKQWIKSLPGGEEVLARIEEAHVRCLDKVLRMLGVNYANFQPADHLFIKDMDLLALHFERRKFFPKTDARWSTAWHVDIFMQKGRMIDALHVTAPAIKMDEFTVSKSAKILGDAWDAGAKNVK